MRKNLIATVFVVIMATIAFWTVAETAPKGKAYGQALTMTAVTRVNDILAGPDQFVGKTVRVEGTIIEECPAGGWFMLKDATGVIFVNLHPSYFAIPQAIGRKATAEGVVKKDYRNISIIGSGVQLP